MSDPIQRPADPASAVSPSLRRDAADQGEAFELKFLLDATLARRVEDFVRHTMSLDVHTNPEHGGYLTTTLYFDTPTLAVLNRDPALQGRKLRIRRYLGTPDVFLEEKTRVGDRVTKTRAILPLVADDRCDLESEVATSPWFSRIMREGSFSPTCRVSYCRTAFFADDGGQPLRLTLDRNIRGAPQTAFSFIPELEPMAILEQEVICELKFRDAMPRLFRDLLRTVTLLPSSVSKYRRIMRAAGRLPDDSPGGTGL